MRKMKDESLDGTKGDYGYGKGSYTQWSNSDMPKYYWAWLKLQMK
mgnify:CR=1 FL=1